MYNQMNINPISMASGGGLGSAQFHDIPGTAPTHKRRVLADELQHLSEALREAHKLVSALDSALHPILSPVPQDPAATAEQAPQSNNVVTIVAEQGRWVYELNTRLNRLLQRLEL